MRPCVCACGNGCVCICAAHKVSKRMSCDVLRESLATHNKTGEFTSVLRRREMVFILFVFILFFLIYNFRRHQCVCVRSHQNSLQIECVPRLADWLPRNTRSHNVRIILREYVCVCVKDLAMWQIKHTPSSSTGEQNQYWIRRMLCATAVAAVLEACYIANNQSATEYISMTQYTHMEQGVSPFVRIYYKMTTFIVSDLELTGSATNCTSA